MSVFNSLGFWQALPKTLHPARVDSLFAVSSQQDFSQRAQRTCNIQVLIDAQVQAEHPRRQVTLGGNV